MSNSKNKVKIDYEKINVLTEKVSRLNELFGETLVAIDSLIKKGQTTETEEPQETKESTAEKERTLRAIKVNGIFVPTMQHMTDEIMSMLRYVGYINDKARFGMVSGIIGILLGTSSLILTIMKICS